jgi:hypothetical protein
MMELRSAPKPQWVIRITKCFLLGIGAWSGVVDRPVLERGEAKNISGRRSNFGVQREVWSPGLMSSFASVGGTFKLKEDFLESALSLFESD